MEKKLMENFTYTNVERIPSNFKIIIVSLSGSVKYYCIILDSVLQIHGL